MVRVLCFGTFDGIHKGHEFFLSQAKSLGTELHVLVSRDSTVKSIKKKTPIYDEHTRLESIRALDVVDIAHVGSEHDRYEILSIVMPDIIVLGHDQTFLIDNLENELHTRGLKKSIMVRLPSYFRNIYSSSNLHTYENFN